MSTISTVIITGGAVATAIFAAGFVRGLRQSIAGRDVELKGEEVSASDRWPAIILAVIASAVIIASIGFWPHAVYIGPLLVLVTAAATGVAFFLDEGVKASKK
jgi:asparagine N-glycosylation enzyme membrane subunit Stt3